MFSSSGDILNLVLAISIAALTIFLVAAVYQVVAGLRKFHRLIAKAEKSVNKAEELISLAKDKIKNGSTKLLIFTEVAKHLLKFMQEKDWTKKKSSENKTGKKNKK